MKAKQNWKQIRYTLDPYSTSLLWLKNAGRRKSKKDSKLADNEYKDERLNALSEIDFYLGLNKAKAILRLSSLVRLST